MRDVAEESPLSVDISGQALCHAANGFAELAQFVAAFHRQLHFEMAVGDLSRCRLEGGDGAR